MNLWIRVVGLSIRTLVYSASMPEQANLKFFFLENSNSTSLRGVARRLFKSRPVESKEKPM